MEEVSNRCAVYSRFDVRVHSRLELKHIWIRHDHDGRGVFVLKRALSYLICELSRFFQKAILPSRSCYYSHIALERLLIYSLLVEFVRVLSEFRVRKCGGATVVFAEARRRLNF